MKKILYLASFDIGKRYGGGLAALCYYNALCEIRPGLVDLMMNEDCCVGKYSGAIKIPPRKGLDYLTDMSLHRGRKFILDYISKHREVYDICVINGSRYCGDMMDNIKACGLKIIVIHHNYEVEYCMSNKYNITLYGRLPQLVAHYERNAYLKADVNCFLTIPDMKALKEAYGQCNGKEFLLGVFDYEHLNLCSSKHPYNDTMVFSGSMSAFQTYHSLELFRKEYYDIVRRCHPNLNFLITGRSPHESIYEFQRSYPEKIQVVPNPENIDEIIEKGDFYICPTCIGGGLKLRVMDGLKKGLPVLVHRISARGYEPFEGQPFFHIYDDAASFKKGLDAIVKFTKENYNYKEKILLAYRNTFSFEAGVRRMREAIDSIL